MLIGGKFKYFQWGFQLIDQQCSWCFPSQVIHIQESNPSKNNILGIFEFFLTDNLISIIVTETNHYACQFMANNKEHIKYRSRVKGWAETNADNIKTFLGLLILGVCFKTDSHMYFLKRGSIKTPFFSHITQHWCKTRRCNIGNFFQSEPGRYNQKIEV